MAGKDDKKKLSPGDFIRYSNGEMTAAERNAFERQLQRDPFADDAAEGFSGIPAGEAYRDLSSLEKRLARRTARRRRYHVYRIAASVAVLMIISSVFIVIDRNRPGEQAAGTTDTAELFIEEPVRAAPPAVSEVIQDEPVKKSTESKERLRPQELVTEESKNQVTAGNYEKNEFPTPEAKNDKKKAVVEGQNNTGIPIVAESRSMVSAAAKGSGSIIIGKVVSAEDNEPVRGATVVIKGTNKGVITDSEGNFSLDLPASNATLVASFVGMSTTELKVRSGEPVDIRLQPDVSALSEVVVVGYGAKAGDKAEESYIPAGPVAGKTEYDRYLRENIHRPDTSGEGQRAVVVTAFTVRIDGTIDSIRIIRSPAKPFSDEAIRLIREGPAWKPAERNGIPVDDEVRIRVVFR